MPLENPRRPASSRMHQSCGQLAHTSGPAQRTSGHRSQELVNVPATSTRDAPAVSSNARRGGGSSAREAG